MSTNESDHPANVRRRRGPWQILAGLLAALAALATIIAVVIANWPTPDPLVKKVTPHLKRLDSANRNLTEALKSLRPTSGVRLSRERSGTAFSVTLAAGSRIGPMDAKRGDEQQLKVTVQAALAAEKTYLGTVRAFLRRTPSKSQQRSFWLSSERLRNRLDDLNAFVPAITTSSVGGANVLSQWFRRKTGKATAISQFPPAQRATAQRQIPANPPGHTTQCSDGVDNDGDDKTDLADSDCASASDTREAADATQCSDGVDNDGDDKTDLADPDCASASDTREAADATQCSDGVDNDGDDKTDLADPDCASAEDDAEAGAPPPAECSDGKDNDGDGKTDLDDPDCVSGDMSESAAGSPAGAQ